MFPKLDSADIRNACGTRTYQRGLQYWRLAKVQRVERTEFLGNPEIVATVTGSGRRNYEVRVQVYAQRGGLEIIGNCTCPVGYNCKHVAAALLKVIKEGGAGPPTARDPVAGWLESLKAIHAEPTGPEPARGDVTFRVLYVLESRSEPNTPYALRMSSYKARVLKRGGYGKPRAMPLEQATAGTGSGGPAQGPDGDIAQLLTKHDIYDFYDQSHHYDLEGELGELALRKILLSGRCYWRDTTREPLGLGTARVLGFEWEDVEGGRRLSPRMAPPASQLFQIAGFWYLDLEQCQIGPLEHTHTSDQLASLLNAPVVPQDRLTEVSRQLVMETPEFELPLPVELDVEHVRIENEVPEPHLLLHSQETRSADGASRHYHCARMDFGYGPLRLEDRRTRTVIQDSDSRTIVYHIDRDAQAEQAAMDTLSDLGLHLVPSPAQPDRLEWFIPGETRAESAWQWHEFLNSELPRLREQGWRLEIDRNFYLSFVEADEWHGEVEQEGNDWFALSLGVEVEGERVDLLPVMVDLLSQSGDARQLRERLQLQPHILLPMGEHRWLKIPGPRLLPIFDTLVELYDQQPLDEEGRLLLARSQGAQIDELLNDPRLQWRGAEELQRLNERLRHFEGIQPAQAPPGFGAQLRPYQAQGLGWLEFLREFEFNGILADDMGLGKTVQTLALLLLAHRQGERAARRPSLVIAPTSLMGNWRREAERFAPALRTLVLHGAERHQHFPRISEHDLILTTYPLLRRDREPLLEHEFHYIVLDEAQAIKNPKAQTSQIVYELRARHRLCLTGTPMENHVGELWSMFHFLMPGYLGTLERFTRLFRRPIEHQGDDSRRESLRRRIRPFLLRRTKTEVTPELPEKTEIVRPVVLEGPQRDLYETIRMAMDQKVRAEIRNKGLARSHIMILDALLKLRQVCCDPRLLSLPQAKRIKRSAKLELLMDMLPGMVEEGRRILLFSQFTRMLGLIETELDGQGIDYTKLTGQTRKRDEVISRFQGGDVPVFLISLKAGGVGLNLTAADTVIHYDPWWNPAVENQATDRAHRIGQDKTVFVYKLITEETVEDKIIALQQKKQALAEAVYSGRGKGPGGLLSVDDLNELLRPLGE